MIYLALEESMQLRGLLISLTMAAALQVWLAAAPVARVEGLKP